MIGVTFSLQGSTGTTLYTFADGFRTKDNKLFLHAIDPSALKVFDNQRRFTRTGDNKPVPESYVIEGVIEGASLAALRTDVNSLETQLIAAFKLAATSPIGIYTVSLLPSLNNISQHGIEIMRVRNNKVKVRIAFNSSLAFPSFTPTEATGPTSEFSWWVRAGDLMFRDVAGSIEALDGEEVKHWGDKSSNSWNAVEGSTSVAPRYYDDVDGIPAVDYPQNFSASGPFLRTPNGEASAVGSFYVLCKPRLNPSGWKSPFAMIPINAAFGSNSVIEIATSNPNVDSAYTFQNPGYARAQPMSLGSWVLIHGHYTLAGGLETFINGYSTGVDTTGSPPSLPGRFYAGANMFNGSSNNRFYGHIAEILVYEEKVGSEDNANNLAYFASRYSDQITIVPPTGADEPLTSELKTNWVSKTGSYIDAGLTPATVGDSVQQLSDSSTNSFNATQGTTANKPVLRSEDGELVLEFDGVNDFMGHNFSTLPKTAYALVKSTDGLLSTYRGIYGGDSTALTWGYSTFGYRVDTDAMTMHTREYPRISTDKDDVNVDNWFVICSTVDPATNKRVLYVDNVEKATSSTSGALTTLAPPFLIGAKTINGGLDAPFQGFVAQIMFYDKVHNEFERLQTQQYLENSWGFFNLETLINNHLVANWDMSMGAYSDAGTTPAIEDGPVHQLDDQSGNGYNATQATLAARPILKTFNGVKLLRFDGTDDFLQFNFTSAPTMRTIYVVQRFTGTTGSNRALISLESTVNPPPPGSAWALFSKVGSTVYFVRNNGNIITSLSEDDIWVVYSVTFNSNDNSTKLFFDNVLKGTDTGTTIEAQGNTGGIGCVYRSNSVIDSFFLGDIAQILVYDAEHRGPQRERIHSYLNNKWTALLNDPYLLEQGLEANWDSTQGLYSDAGITPAVLDDPVQEWHDQVNGLVASESGSIRPTLKSIDGVNTVFFDGTQYLKHTLSTEPQTIYVVYKTTETANVDRALFGSANSVSSPVTSYYLRSTSTTTNQAQWVRHSGGSRFFTRTVNAWTNVTVTYDNSTFLSEVFKDNISQGTDGGTSKVSIGSTSAIGGYGTFNGTVSNLYLGYVAQILVYSVKHTSAQRAKMQQYLEDKWSVL